MLLSMRFRSLSLQGKPSATRQGSRAHRPGSLTLGALLTCTARLAPACDRSAGGAAAGSEQGAGGSRAAVTAALLARSEAALPRALLPLPPFLAQPHGASDLLLPPQRPACLPQQPALPGPCLAVLPTCSLSGQRVWPATSLPATQGTCEQRWARRKTHAEPAAQKPLPCTGSVPRLHGGPAQSPPTRCRRATGPARGARARRHLAPRPLLPPATPQGRAHQAIYRPDSLGGTEKRMYFMQHSFSRRRRGPGGAERGLRVRGTQAVCERVGALGSAPFSAVLRVERESNWVLLV